jgi:hypothetical protein
LRLWAHERKIDVVRATRKPRVGGRPEAGIGDFVVCGIVDGLPTTARWSGRTLHADANVRARCELIVALGDVFSVDIDVPPIEATLDPNAPRIGVLLTVIRAFDRLTAVEVATAP